MKTLRGARCLLCVPCLVHYCFCWGATFRRPGARADQWDKKKTIVTFNDAVEIPGQVLPAGTYVLPAG